jgi:hypothetical protein
LAEKSLCFLANITEDYRGGAHRRDKGSRLSEQQWNYVPITAPLGIDISWYDLIKAVTELVFSSVPLLNELVVVDSGCNPFGPARGVADFGINDVTNRGVDSILSIALNDAVLVDIRHLGILQGSYESGANPGAFGASGQNGGQGAATGDATGGYHRDMRELIDEANQEGQQVHSTRVAARLVPLSRQDIGASSDSYTSGFYRLDLAYGCGAPLLGPAQPGSGIGEGEKDNRHLLLQGCVEVLGR